MKKMLSCVLASTLALQLASHSLASEPVIGASDWAVPYITTAISQNLVPSHLQSDYTTPITRGEFCSLAVAVYEEKIGSEISERIMFTDTSDLNVEKAAGIGVVSGKSEGVFDPDAEITRQEAAIILTQLATATGNTLAEALPNFTDNENIASWASESVGKVQNSGIMSGVNDSEFSPLGTYTREASITTLLRVFQLNSDETSEKLAKLGELGSILSGYIDNVGETTELSASAMKNFEGYIAMNESFLIWAMEEDLDALQLTSQAVVNGIEETISLCGDDEYLAQFVVLAQVAKTNYQKLAVNSVNTSNYFEASRKIEIAGELYIMADLVIDSFNSYKEMVEETSVILETLQKLDSDSVVEEEKQDEISLSEILFNIVDVQKETAELLHPMINSTSEGTNAISRYNTTKMTSYLSTVHKSNESVKTYSSEITVKLRNIIELCGSHQEFSQYKALCLEALSYFDKVVTGSSGFDAYSLQYYGNSYISGMSKWNEIGANVLDGIDKFEDAVEECGNLFQAVS